VAILIREFKGWTDAELPTNQHDSTGMIPAP